MRGVAPAHSKPRMLYGHHRQAISTTHPLPVIFIRRSTNDTNLIVLPIDIESWPSKPMGAKFSDESLQECHVYPSSFARSIDCAYAAALLHENGSFDDCAS